MQKVLILANPTAGAGAGRVNKQRLVEVAQRDIAHGRKDLEMHVDVTFKTSREGVVEAAAKARDTYDVVVAAGGDGTINAVVNGLLSGENIEYTKLPILGILPIGTGNVFAHNLGIGRGLREACRAIRTGNMRTVDIGLARSVTTNTRHFLLMAGIGFDAKVVEDTSLRLKYVLRDFAYVLKILQNGISHRGTLLNLKFREGNEYSSPSWLVMVGNAASYAWDIRFTSHARLDDGMLDVCLFPFENKVASVRQVLQVLTGQHIERGTVQYWKTAGLTLDSDEPVPVQLDGDEWTRTPVEITVIPAALRVLAPMED
jgi:YegS/Rv2252/BmrU family lipid kinase